MKVAINNFVRRQTPESPFTHFNGSDEELLALVNDSLNAKQYKTGYRDGVLLVRVSPENFFTGFVELKEGDELVGEFKARQKGEAPRISIMAKKSDKQQSKCVAKCVEIIIYSHDVLTETGEHNTDDDYEIISINGYPTEEPAPIDPFTLMHNHFQSDGGTATNMSSEEFEAALKESFEYHKNKALIE